MKFVTVTSGPTVNLFEDGKLVFSKQLSLLETLRIIESLSYELRLSQ